MHDLEARRQACYEAESKCQQMEAWLFTERQTIQDLLALKSEFEEQIVKVQEHMLPRL